MVFLDLFQERLKEHKATFNPTVIRDFMDSYLLEQMKEKAHSHIKHYTGKQFSLQLKKWVQLLNSLISENKLTGCHEIPKLYYWYVPVTYSGDYALDVLPK